MIANRADRIKPFIVMEVLEKAQLMEKNGISIIHLEVGEPDFETPKCIKKAVKRALEEGFTNYTHSLGLIELREAVCDNYYRKYNVKVKPDRVVITSGTSPAIFLVLSSLLEKKDQVIISDPNYPCYSNFIEFLSGDPIKIPVYEEDGFQFKTREIEKKINKKTKALFINSPSNPTGNILSKTRMKEIADLAEKNNFFVISDEIYHGLVYKGTEHSILEFTDTAFVLNGFSKLYAMTGFRLGYLIAPLKFIRPIQKIQQNFFISAGSTSQAAGIAALKEAEKDAREMNHIYNQRRQYMVKRLKALGFGITVEPTGAFYVFANASHILKDSYKLAFDILEKAHVGVTPGIDFGQNGEGYLRFSYANSLENIKEGLNRIETYLKRL